MLRWEVERRCWRQQQGSAAGPGLACGSICGVGRELQVGLEVLPGPRASGVSSEPSGTLAGVGSRAAAGAGAARAVTAALFVVAEVTLKVHVSDASTHQPVAEAFIEIFTNQISIASGTSGADGTAFLKFQYKLGSQLTVTASKHAYVPNSAPWKPVRLPGKSPLVFF